jgi:hypothetical protein
VVVAMGSNPIALLAYAAGASLLAVLPLWCVITLVVVATALAATLVTVTQIIRLPANSKITTSAHVLRLLEIEDSR